MILFRCALRAPTKITVFVECLFTQVERNAFASLAQHLAFLILLFCFVFFLLLRMNKWDFIWSVHIQHDCEIYCTIIHLIIANFLLWCCFQCLARDDVWHSARVEWKISLCKYLLPMQISKDSDCSWLLKASAALSLCIDRRKIMNSSQSFFFSFMALNTSRD